MAAAVATALAWGAPATAAPGTPDSGFGSGGTATFDLGYPGSQAPMSHGSAAAWLADGRIAIAGTRGGGTGTFQQLGARLTAAGALDAGFGNGQGWASTSEELGGVPAGVFPDGDGGLTLAGSRTGGTGTEPYALRMLPSGQLDPGYGNGGVAPSPAQGGGAIAIAALRQPDGRVVVAGTMDLQGRRGLFAARFTAAGQVDGSFGSGGRYVQQVASGSYGDSGISSIALQADGKLVFAGFRSDSATGSDASRYLLAGRLNANGTPDPSFGDGGFTTVPFTSWGFVGDPQIAPLPDGGALAIGGYRRDSSANDLIIARLGADGRAVATKHLPVGVEPYPYDAAASPGGKAVVVGYTHTAEDLNPVPFAVRLTAAGDADPGWAQGGVWLSGARGRADAVAVDASGAAALTGSDAQDRLTVTRLLGDGGGTGAGAGAGGPGGGANGGGGASGGGTGTASFRMGRPVWRRGVLSVRVRCTASKTCRGKASLLPRRGRGRALGTKRFKAAPGRAVRLKIRPRRRPRTARLTLALSAPQRTSHTVAVRLR
jgi:uncharacterized delta-60 repeat protein